MKYYSYLQMVSLFLLAIGVTASIGKLIGASAVLALLALILNRDREIYLKKSYFYKTVIYYLTFVVFVIGISYYHKNLDGIKEAYSFFERILPFYIIWLLLGNVRHYFAISGLGISCGLYLEIFQLLPDFVIKGERIGGVFGHPNILAAALLQFFPVLIFLTFIYLRNKFFRITMIIGIVGWMILFSMTESRGAFIGCCIEAILTVLYWLKYESKFEVLKNFSWCKAAVVVLLAIFLIGVGTWKVVGRRHDMERSRLWCSTVNMIKDYPVLGVGLKNFNRIYTKNNYISKQAKEPNLKHAHNIILGVLVEFGIVGFVGYLLMMFGRLKLAKDFLQSVNNSISVETRQLLAIFVIVLVGLHVHGMVDYVILLRKQLQINFFIWGLACMSMAKDEAVYKLQMAKNKSDTVTQ